MVTRTQSVYEAAGGTAGLERLAAEERAIAWPMSAYPDSPADVPDGLVVPRWSWSGLTPAGGPAGT